MNYDNISKAMMLVFDELKNDAKSKKLIEQIDSADDDAQLKAGIKKGITRLRELEKGTLADEVESLIKGW